MNHFCFLALLMMMDSVVRCQDQTTTPTSTGPVPKIICDWASCQGLCPSSGPVQGTQSGPGLPCSELLPESAKISRCRGTYEYCLSMDGTQLAGKRCKPGQYETVCFSIHYDETIHGNNTVLCLAKVLSSCMGIADYCDSNGQQCVNTMVESTSQPPSTGAVTTEAIGAAETTRNHAWSTPQATVVTMTTKAIPNLTITYGTTPQPKAPPLAFLSSHPFLVGLAVGLLIITPCLLCMLVYCLKRRKPREKTEETQGYEMNVYQSVGPELPPNHPSIKAGRSPSILTAVSGVSYQELDAESRFTMDDCNSQQSLQMSRTSLDHRSELGSVRYDASLPSKYRKSTKRTNSFAMVTREAYRNGRHTRSLYNSDSCIAKSSGNKPAYATLQLRDDREYGCGGYTASVPHRTSSQRSEVDRPLMALNLAGMEARKDTQEREGTFDRRADPDSTSNPRDTPSETDHQQAVAEPTGAENDLPNLPRSIPVTEMPESSEKSDGDGDATQPDHMGQKAGGGGNESLQNVGSSENTPRRLGTFPRRKGHSTDELDRRGDVEDGSETPSKSKFRSLRFVSRKSRRARKWKKASDGELCLDLKISSPTTPEAPEGQSFFTAAIPIVPIAPIENTLGTEEANELTSPPEQETPDCAELPDTTGPVTVPSITSLDVSKLQLPLSSDSQEEDIDTSKLHPQLEYSQSQEFLPDDVAEEPFRNRSCSQPIRQTFSPSLNKDYKEIRESWGATYLQNYNIEEDEES